MPITIRVKGLSELQKLAAVLPVAVKETIREGIEESAIILKNKSQEAITTSPTRAIDTGNLRRSISVIHMTQSSAQIAPLANYAIYVHEGLGTSRRIGPRRFMNRGARLAGPVIEGVFKRRIKDLLDSV